MLYFYDTRNYLTLFYRSQNTLYISLASVKLMFVRIRQRLLRDYCCKFVPMFEKYANLHVALPLNLSSFMIT